MFLFMFKEFGLYPACNKVFLMGGEQGSITIKETLFDSSLHDKYKGEGGKETILIKDEKIKAWDKAEEIVVERKWHIERESEQNSFRL